MAHGRLVQERRTADLVGANGLVVVDEKDGDFRCIEDLVDLCAIGLVLRSRLLFWMSQAVHHPDTRAVHTYAMAQYDDSDGEAWLDASNMLVQMGLVEVVSITEYCEPSYPLALRIRDVRIISRSHR